MYRLTAVLRTPKGLIAQTSHRCPKFTETRYDLGIESGEWDGFYESRSCRLEEWADPSFDRDRLLHSWKTLASVTRWDEETLFHILLVLIESDPVYHPINNQKLAPLTFPSAPQPVRPTSAHPRGYPVTKSKTATPSPVNLHPYLCQKKHVKVLLRELFAFWPGAFARLAGLGYDTDALPADPRNLSLDTDPYFAVHHGYVKSIKNLKLPDRFVQYLLPALKGLGMKKVREFLAVYWELSLEDDNALLLGVSRLLSFTATDTALKICKVVSAQPTDERVELLVRFIENYGFKIPHEAYSAEEIKTLIKLIPKNKWHLRSRAVIGALQDKVPLHFIKSGLHLAQRFSSNVMIEGIMDCPEFPFQIYEKILERIQKPPTHFTRQAHVLWAECGWRKWFTQVIPEVGKHNFSPEVTWKTLSLFFFDMDRNCTADKNGSKRLFIQKQIPRIMNFLKTMDPEYRVTFLENIADFHCYWDNQPIEASKVYLDSAFRLLENICQTPFKKTSYTSAILSYFIDLTDCKTRNLFLQAPASSFLNLQKATRSSNQGVLIKIGLISLLRHQGEFTVNCFQYFSNQLFKVARLLGLLYRFQRVPIMKEFFKHPLMKPAIETLKVQHLCKLVKKFLEPDVTNPIPKKMEAWLSGNVDLTNNQIDRAIEQLNKNLYSTRLSILEKLLWKSYRSGYPCAKDDETWKHTLLFLNKIECNRRPIKKLLKAYCEGKPDYLQTHPKTTQWIQRHKRIPIESWTQGFEMSRTTENFGAVRINLEPDPLEVLKMGTYVGSCLGLGGDYSYSAAAVVLDINKQVLFARDSNNKVLGRQLVAISKNNELVCFEVYPVNATGKIKDLFLEYDLSLAEKLQIPLFEEGVVRKPRKKSSRHGIRANEEGYEIENIISTDWYDDYAWDFR